MRHFWKWLLLSMLLCLAVSLGVQAEENTDAGETCEETELTLDAPVIKSVKNTDSGVKLTWSKVADAESYQIYRKKGSGSLVLIGETAAKTCTCLDGTAASGSTYTYSIVAVAGEVASEYASTTIKYLARTTLTVDGKTDTSVTLSWSKVSGAGKYQIWRKASGGSYTLVKSVSSKKLTYTDSKVSANTKYTYKVVVASGSYTSADSKAVSVKTLKTVAAVTLKITAKSYTSVSMKWTKSSDAKKYRVYRSTKKNGTYELVATLKKSVLKYTDETCETGTTYYYKVVAVNGSRESKATAKKAKTKTAPTVSTVSAAYAIEADVTLTGSGTGYHAKLVVGTGAAAVSFGIQFDNYASAPYTGKAAFLVENVASNASGGQTYTRFSYNGSAYATVGETYHLMLTCSSAGVVDCYVNYEKVGSVTNKNLAGQVLYLWVEGAARKNGDTVNASFSNVKLRNAGSLKTAKISYIQKATGITTNVAVNQVPTTITIKGTLTALASSADWDSAYDQCQGYVRFY